ncbi:MAG: exopolysaccharide biosynthesis polyprenyl glycosylphosphotransferase [Nitrospinaceae bacterium]
MMALVFLDALFLLGLFYIFTFVRQMGLGVPERFWPTLLLPLGWVIVVLPLVGGYSLDTNMRGLNYAGEHLIAVIVSFFLTIISIYSFTFEPAYQFSRSVLPLSFFTFFFLSLSYRRAIYSWLNPYQEKRFFLILGAGNMAREVFLDCIDSGIKQTFRVLDSSNRNVGGRLCGPESPVIEGQPITQFESLNGLHDAVIIADDRRKLNHELVESLINCHFNGTPILSVEKFYENYLNRIPSAFVHPQLLLREGFDFPRNPVFENIKRFIDILFSTAALGLSSPLFIFIPLLIRLESQGPVFFRQERTGKNNASFHLIKFRTMVTDSANGPVCTEKSDPRITRVGKWLRTLHLDELPQLWNVLMGQMSMIGPRPEQTRLTRIYERQFFCYRFRHLVKPGITGWAQVNYAYGEDLNDALKKFEYDLYYIRHFSFMMDATIVLKTASQIVMGRGR